MSMTAQEIIRAQIRAEISEDEATARLVAIYERGETARHRIAIISDLAYALVWAAALTLGFCLTK